MLLWEDFPFLVCHNKWVFLLYCFQQFSNSLTFIVRVHCMSVCNCNFLMILINCDGICNRKNLEMKLFVWDSLPIFFFLHAFQIVNSVSSTFIADFYSFLFFWILIVSVSYFCLTSWIFKWNHLCEFSSFFKFTIYVYRMFFRLLTVPMHYSCLTSWILKCF